MAKTRKVTKYQRLLKAKKSHCAGRTDKSSLNRAATAYINDAVAKGKTKTEARKIANKVINGSCTVKKKTKRKKRKR